MQENSENTAIVRATYAPYNLTNVTKNVLTIVYRN